MCIRDSNSYGNGSAMRVSFIGQYFDTLEEVEEQARIMSLCTHKDVYKRQSFRNVRRLPLRNMIAELQLLIIMRF